MKSSKHIGRYTRWAVEARSPEQTVTSRKDDFAPSAEIVSSRFKTSQNVEDFLVDFSEALKARIDSMSADELAATEVRRLFREAERAAVATLDALWEQSSGGNTVAMTKAVTVQVDAGAAGAPDILRIDQGATFHESIVLGLSVYRTIAGGSAGGALSERFVITPGSLGRDKVSVDRAALAAIMRRKRPVEMARSCRLVAVEQHPHASRFSAAERIAQFEEKWVAETVNLQIDAVLAMVPSRAVMLLTGRDQVALWVRMEDVAIGPDRLLGSAFAAAIVRPGAPRTRHDVSVPESDVAAGNSYHRNSFGSGPERTLILDVAQIRKMIGGMARQEAREAALSHFARVIARSAVVGRERVTRGKMSVVRIKAGHG